MFQFLKLKLNLQFVEPLLNYYYFNELYLYCFLLIIIKCCCKFIVIINFTLKRKFLIFYTLAKCRFNLLEFL